MDLDLPLVWAGIIALAVLLYVMLDGFDLGIGILFPFARSPRDRDTMMNSIAPYWDGNETWLVLGGGGLFAAFPLAYAIIMPALYIPILLMMMALILRGVAFEFRARGRTRGKAFWTGAFAGGSTVAALSQGLVLGGFIQGVTLNGEAFGGGPFDWLTPYTLLVAGGLTAGDARRWAWRAAIASAALLVVVSLATLFVHPQVAARWGFEDGAFDLARLALLSPIPLLGLAGLGLVVWGLAKGGHVAPFLGSLTVFVSGYLGLAVGFFPNIVPYDLTFRQAASADNALGLMLVGVAILLPVILAYTVWVYWVFRGKVGADAGYH